MLDGGGSIREKKFNFNTNTKTIIERVSINNVVDGGDGDGRSDEMKSSKDYDGVMSTFALKLLLFLCCWMVISDLWSCLGI